ncbi:MAG: flagellar filament capping protein FliD [Limnobacter sp.]|nr:flagellar filament capping protein FliD [Limnobacter sp.]
MPTISSAGVGSGLDIEGIISGLMAAERIPLQQITEQRQSINTKISIYGVIKNSFATLQASAKKLTNLSNIYPQKATSSADTVISATASSSATPGNYRLEVSKLAQAQSLAGDTVPSKDDVFGQGTLTITLGEYDSDLNTFTANPDKTPVPITIGAGQNTLTGIKQAINNADSGVKATIINDGSGDRLVLTSSETGKDLGFKIDVTDNDGNNTDQAGLSRLAYDPTVAAAPGSGNNVQTLQQSQNAEFTINNLAISKRSNTVSDAVEGVTFNLKQQTTGPVDITVALDSSTLKKTLDEFVSSYNKIRGNLKDQQEKTATLSKETTPARLESGLRNVLRSTVEATGLTLTEIGFSFDKTGVLSLNQTKLDEALANDPRILEKLFSDTAEVDNANVSYLGGNSKTQSGTYAINISANAGGGASIAGTVGGIAGTGVENVFTAGAGAYASGNAEGLQFSVVEGVTGALGNISFSKGLASQLDEWITSLSEDGGMLDSRTDGLNGKLNRLQNQEDRFNLRLEQIEKRYRAQFVALDSMLASMQQTSTYLSQQLAALSQQR